MGAGAVIKINYEYPSFGYALGASALGGTELFSDVIEPIKKAKAFGRTIKTELQKISTQMDMGSTIEHLIDQSSESAKAKSEISESANSARTDQEVVYGALTNVTEKLTTFGETVVEVDRKAASLIRERKLEFNRRYPHLESETEYRQRMDDRSGWEKAKDFGYGLFHGGIIGGFDSLINGRERFIEHKEAIKQKIAEFATKVGNWVKKNWQAIITAVIVVAGAIACILSFGAGTVFLVAAIAAFAYAVTDKIVAINNGGKGIVETLEANGFHDFAQTCKGFNWGLQITMLISGFKMSGAGFSIFKGSGFWATVGNGAVFGGGYNMAVDLAAYGINFGFSKDAQANPLEYLKTALKDTVKDTATGAVVGGVVAGISYTVIKGISFLRSKFTTPHITESQPNAGEIASNADGIAKNATNEKVEIVRNSDGTFEVSRTGSNGTTTETRTYDQLINSKTCEYQIQHGEMEYDFNEIFLNTHEEITNAQARDLIQEAAVATKLRQDPTYFNQFDCEISIGSGTESEIKQAAKDIVGWFSKSDTYSLHEPYIDISMEHITGKVQIVPSTHQVVHHTGGSAQAAQYINDSIKYDRYISDLFHNPSSPMRSKTVGEMHTIYDTVTSGNGVFNPNRYNTHINLNTKTNRSYISDIFGYGIP